MKKNMLLLAVALSSATLLFGQNTPGNELMGASGDGQAIVQSSDNVRQMNDAQPSSPTTFHDEKATTPDISKSPVDYSKNPYWAPQDFRYILQNGGGN